MSAATWDLDVDARAAGPAALIRSSRFRAEREADWRRLDALLREAERRGVRALRFREAQELAALYRGAMASLSVAREISLDASLVAYLDSLCARATLVVYAPRPHVSRSIWRFVAEGAPAAMRRSAPFVLLAVAIDLLGGLAGFLAVAGDPTWYYALVPADLAGGRGPGASAEALRAVIYDEDPGSLGALGAFAAHLFSHNTQVALFAFALGLLAGIPTALLGLYNGAILGAFFAVHQRHGLSFDLFGWLSIHGVTELGAIAVAMGGGFRLGAALLFPGPRSRGAALAFAGHDATKLAIVAATMLLAGGILEGFGRQLVIDPAWRIAIGWGIGALWVLWFALGGRGEERRRARHARSRGDDPQGQWR